MPYRPRNKRVLRPPFKVPGGFRFIKGTGPKVTKGLIKRLENQETLTDSQNYIIEEHLKSLHESASPAHVARILALTEKPIVKALVDQYGNPVSNKAVDELEDFSKKSKEEQIAIIKERLEKNDEPNEQTNDKSNSDSRPAS